MYVALAALKPSVQHVMTVMGTFLKLCLVHIRDLIRVFWSGPRSGASSHLLPLLCSGAFDPQCVSQPPCPSHPWRRSKVSFSTPVPDLLLLSTPLHSSLQCRDDRTGGCKESCSRRAGDRGESHIVFEVRWLFVTQRFVRKGFDFLGNMWSMPTKQ